MNFGRLPFQFSATDPVARQSELMRRFGVPADDKMLLENQHVMDSLSHASPRLQHRLPGYLAGESHPVKSFLEGCAESVDSQQREPRVRVVPIKIEGDSGTERPARQRTRSGGATIPIKVPDLNSDEDHIRQRCNSGTFIPSFNSHVNSEFPANRSRIFYPSSEDQQVPEVASSPKSRTQVCNIPIVIEGKDSNKKNATQCRSVPIQRELSKSNETKMGNGPCVSKSASEAKSSVSKVKKEQSKKPDFNDSLKQIEKILKDFEAYKEGVDKFDGVQGDKQYRYLDEMLTQCMLKLDDIETLGNEEVRKARKNAVRQVQDAINVLDSKIQPKRDEKDLAGGEVGPETNMEADGSLEETALDVPKEGSSEILNAENQDVESKVVENEGNMPAESAVDRTEDVMDVDQSKSQVNDVSETSCTSAMPEDKSESEGLGKDEQRTETGPVVDEVPNLVTKEMMEVDAKESHVEPSITDSGPNEGVKTDPTAENVDSVEQETVTAVKTKIYDNAEKTVMDVEPSDTSDIVTNGTGDREKLSAPSEEGKVGEGENDVEIKGEGKVVKGESDVEIKDNPTMCESENTTECICESTVMENSSGKDTMEVDETV